MLYYGQPATEQEERKSQKEKEEKKEGVGGRKVLFELRKMWRLENKKHDAVRFKKIK